MTCRWHLLQRNARVKKKLHTLKEKGKDRTAIKISDYFYRSWVTRVLRADDASWPSHMTAKERERECWKQNCRESFGHLVSNRRREKKQGDGAAPSDEQASTINGERRFNGEPEQRQRSGGWSNSIAGHLLRRSVPANRPGARWGVSCGKCP